MSLTRTPVKATAIILINAAISGMIPMADFSGGSLLFPAAWTAANAGFKVCSTPDGTYIPFRDQVGGLVQITNIQAAEAGAYPLPDELFGCMYFKVWSCTAAGVDTNQAAARTITVVLKG